MDQLARHTFTYFSSQYQTRKMKQNKKKQKRMSNDTGKNQIQILSGKSTHSRTPSYHSIPMQKKFLGYLF